MLERCSSRIRTPQPEPLLDAPLVDQRRRHSPQPEQQADDARTQHAVDIGHSVDTPLPSFAGKAQQTAQPLVTTAVVGLQKIDIQSRKEGFEQRPREHCDTNVGIGIPQGAKGVRQHRHIAHRRIANYQNMSRQLFTS